MSRNCGIERQLPFNVKNELTHEEKITTATRVGAEEKQVGFSRQTPADASWGSALFFFSDLPAKTAIPDCCVCQL